jgi:ERF superfamily
MGGEVRSGRRAPGWAAEPQTNADASDADARSFVSLSGRGEFGKIRSRIGVVERAPLTDKLDPRTAAGRGQMKMKIGKANEKTLAPVGEAKRGARVREIAIRQEASRAATADEQTDRTQKLEQTERATERPLPTPPSDNGSSTILSLIEQLALDPRADVEKLEHMIPIYERLKAKEAELAYNAAKSRVLKKLASIKIVKNRSVLYEIEKGKPQNRTYEAFKYAPLEEIDRHLRPLLTEEEMDLSYSDEPREGGGILIRGRLTHLPGGHYEDSFMPAPPDTTGGKSDVQAVGSTNSYLRRYVACNIFNIVVVGDDDDGTGGTIDEAQAKTILELIKKAKVGVKFLKYMKALSIAEAGSLEAAVATIAARDYRKAITTLQEQIVKAEAGRADLST